MSALASWWSESAAGRWYAGRERNEQRIVLALTLLVVVSLGWLLAWKPVSDWHDQAVLQQANAVRTLDFVKANEAAAKAAAQKPGASRGALVPLVTSTASRHGVTLSRVQPEDSGLLNVVIQGQPFDGVVQWLADLERRGSVQVQQASIKSEDRTGYVNAQIRFQ